MDNINSELQSVKQIIEYEISFLDKYFFYSNIFNKNKRDYKDDKNLQLLQEYFQHSNQVESVINKRADLLSRINSQIQNNCDHTWETDLIDIDPDRSQTIKYCTKCEKTV